MAKFYQHMEPGDLLGKITKLKYIDDISDDELIIYVFEDKTKCSESFISEVNNLKAFNGTFVMTELTDPLNSWTFTVKEFNMNKTQKVYGENWQVFEVPDPGISINGEHVSLKVDEEGNTLPANSNMMAGKRTDATPPIVKKNVKLEPKENYLLSLHPELLSGKPSNKDISLIDTTLPTSAKDKNMEVSIKDNTLDVKVSKTDNLLNLDENNEIYIILDGKKTLFNKKDLINKLNNKTDIISDTDNNENEDILIKELIDRSKKELYTIGVDFDLELPPSDLYNMIKKVYDENTMNSFINSVSKRINISVLKNALSEAIKSYYENADN